MAELGLSRAWHLGLFGAQKNSYPTQFLHSVGLMSTMTRISTGALAKNIDRPRQWFTAIVNVVRPLPRCFRGQPHRAAELIRDVSPTK